MGRSMRVDYSQPSGGRAKRSETADKSEDNQSSSRPSISIPNDRMISRMERSLSRPSSDTLDVENEEEGGFGNDGGDLDPLEFFLADLDEDAGGQRTVSETDRGSNDGRGRGGDLKCFGESRNELRSNENSAWRKPDGEFFFFIHKLPFKFAYISSR